MQAERLQTSTVGSESAKCAPAYDACATRKLGALRGLGRNLDPRDPRVVREAATLLVSQLFFAPLLAEMRKLPFGKGLVDGGRMEEVFGEQLDLRIADTVARGDEGLTKQLAERLTPPEGRQSTQTSTPLDVSWRTEMQVREDSEGSRT